MSKRGLNLWWSFLVSFIALTKPPVILFAISGTSSCATIFQVTLLTKSSSYFRSAAFASLLCEHGYDRLRISVICTLNVGSESCFCGSEMNCIIIFLSIFLSCRAVRHNLRFGCTHQPWQFRCKLGFFYNVLKNEYILTIASYNCERSNIFPVHFSEYVYFVPRFKYNVDISRCVTQQSFANHELGCYRRHFSVCLIKSAESHFLFKEIQVRCWKTGQASKN